MEIEMDESLEIGKRDVFCLMIFDLDFEFILIKVGFFKF